jgi:hypothetical protein
MATAVSHQQDRRPRSWLVRRLLIGALVLAIAAAVGMAAPHVGVFASSTPRSAAHGCPIPKSSFGLSGIVPTHPCQVPSFAAADVIAFYHLKNVGGVYIQTVNLRAGYPPSQLISIQFLPAAQVDAILKDHTGMPAAYLLCLVQFQGKFDTKGVLGVPYEPPRAGTPTPPVFATRNVAVFDATTGNTIEWGMW